MAFQGDFPDHIDFCELGGVHIDHDCGVVIALRDLIIFFFAVHRGAVVTSVPTSVHLFLLGGGNLAHFLLLNVLGSEVHFEEFEADNWELLEVKVFSADELAEELSDFGEVEDGDVGSLGLARGAAPREELCEVALDWRLGQKVVYDLELCLRNLEIRVHGKLLEEGEAFVHLIVVGVLCVDHEHLFALPCQQASIFVGLCGNGLAVGLQVVNERLHESILLVEVVQDAC